jgi:hypothetical protein
VMRYELFFWVTSSLFNVLSVALAENKVRRALLVDSQPTCSTPCNFDTRCSISNDGCPICRKNRCVSIPSCNSNCTLSEDCRGAFDNCSVCSPVNKQCVQPFPRCNMACSRDLDCSDGERTDNCGTCNLVRRVCVSSLPYRGSYCFSDDHCAGARDGAAVCNLAQGSCVISLPHRGSSCSANFDCQGSTDGSSLCVSGVCVPPGTLAPNPKCNAQCISDCNCWGATDGCIFCVEGYCTYNRYDNSNTRRCGLGCLSSSECLGSISDGCQRCQNNICVYGPSDTPTNKTVTSAPCISTEQELRNKLSQTNTIITLCENSDITLSQELIVTTAVTLQCAKPKKCTIQGGGRNRLITFTTGNVKTEGVTFQNGDSEGNVSVCFLPNHFLSSSYQGE